MHKYSNFFDSIAITIGFSAQHYFIFDDEPEAGEAGPDQRFRHLGKNGSTKTQIFSFSVGEDEEGEFATEITVVPDVVDMDIFSAPGVTAATTRFASAVGTLIVAALL